MANVGLQCLRPGSLQDAALGSVLMPLGDYSAHFLVTGGAEGELFGVFLSGDHLFHTVMVSQDGDNWNGFFVDGARVEVDIDSATDATNLRPPVGSIVVRSAGIFLVALAGAPRAMHRRVELRLGLPQTGANDRAGVAFTRWSIVIGEAQERVVLREVEAIDTSN